MNLRTNKKGINYKFLHINILKLYLIAIKNNKFKLKNKFKRTILLKSSKRIIYALHYTPDFERILFSDPFRK